MTKFAFVLFVITIVAFCCIFCVTANLSVAKAQVEYLYTGTQYICTQRDTSHTYDTTSDTGLVYCSVSANGTYGANNTSFTKSYSAFRYYYGNMYFYYSYGTINDVGNLYYDRAQNNWIYKATSSNSYVVNGKAFVTFTTFDFAGLSNSVFYSMCEAFSLPQDSITISQYTFSGGAEFAGYPYTFDEEDLSVYDISDYFIIVNAEVYSTTVPSTFNLYLQQSSVGTNNNPYEFQGTFALGEPIFIHSNGNYKAVLFDGTANSIESNVYNFSEDDFIGGFVLIGIIENGEDRYREGYEAGYAAGNDYNEKNNLIQLVWSVFKMPYELMFGTLQEYPADSGNYRRVGGLFSITVLGVDMRAFVLGLISFVLVLRIVGFLLGNIKG